ncbi:MAG: AI-2E family transporter [Candidatus Saccharibacteria bacterium]|nr:AI-2E family transporter [Candidatus Saccharibacteria bacterium]
MKLLGSRHKATEISISNDTIIRTILIVAATVITFRVLADLTHILTLIGVSFFLALALNPAVGRISRAMNIKSRAGATGIAYIFVIAILVMFAALVVPPLVRQTTDFLKSLPETINDFQASDTGLSRFIERYDLDEQLRNIGNEISGRAGDISGPVLSTAGRIGGTIVSSITVLILTFMMLVEGPYWLSKILDMQPKSERERRRKIAYKMYKVVTGYVNGQVLIAGIAASFSAIALFIGNTLADTAVNPIAMAGIVFLFGLIPMIGNTLAAAIVVIFSLFSSPGLALGMAIFFLIYQQTENATLQPYIQSKSNDLTPLIVFLSAILGAAIGGILGALAAIPVAGCLRVLFDEYVVGHLPTVESIQNDQKT